MSVTWDIQTRQFPPAATHDLAHDGAPLDSRIGIDLMTGVNNLAYAMPFAGYVQSFNSKESGLSHQAGTMYGLLNDNASVFASGEYFLAQVPTVLPLVTAERLRWTLGVIPLPTNSTTGTVTIADINLYISPEPYRGNLGSQPISLGSGTVTYLPFDASKMGFPYGVTTNACNIVVTNPTSAPPYVLVDNSVGSGVSAWTPGLASPPGSVLARTNLILTANISRSGGGGGESNIGLRLADFTWWVTPE